ncbi:MAG: InlB B-repeat-containing protein [Dehalococcoidia bacterium]
MAGCVGAECGLTIATTSGGSVVTPGDGTSVYYVGELVSLVATPHTGYRFATWTGDVDAVADVQAPSTTVIMNGSYLITANFEEIPTARFELTVSSTTGGSVTTPGEGAFTYGEGEIASLVARTDEGYRFVHWTGDVDTIADIEAPSTTITMNGNYSIGAHFQVIPPQQYNLAMSSTDGGTVVTPGEGVFTYDDGQVVALVAEAEEGHRFVNWTGDVDNIASVESASTTIAVNGDSSIRANFQQVSPGQFSLTTSSTTGGSVTAPGEGAFTYDDGAVVSLTATAASGYYFVNWTGDVGTIDDVNASSTTIAMNSNCSVRANFSADSSSPPGIGYTEAEAEALIIVLVNDERQQFDLSPLTEDTLLTSLAREHSISMVENGFFGHERYPGERSLSYNQPPGTIRGENLAMIPTRRTIPGPYLSLQEVCEWAVSAWMSSSGHRSNILEPRYTRTGVGVAFSAEGDYLYITQIFEGAY